MVRRLAMYTPPHPLAFSFGVSEPASERASQSVFAPVRCQYQSVPVPVPVPWLGNGDSTQQYAGRGLRLSHSQPCHTTLRPHGHAMGHRPRQPMHATLVLVSALSLFITSQLDIAVVLIPLVLCSRDFRPSRPSPSSPPVGGGGASVGRWPMAMGKLQSDIRTCREEEEKNSELAGQGHGRRLVLKREQRNSSADPWA